MSSTSAAAPHLRLSLNRPERRNAITVAMYAALADAITAAQDDPDMRVITLEGEGVDFTGGNDLADFMKEMPQDGHDRYSGLAAAEGARDQQAAVGRRGAWQCGRDRHDHAVPLRPCRRGGKYSLQDALHRTRAGPRSGEFADPSRAGRPPARRQISPDRRAVRGRRGRALRPCHPPRRGGPAERLEQVVAACWRVRPRPYG